MAERQCPYLKARPVMCFPRWGGFSGFLLVPLGIVVVYSFITKGIYGGVVFHFTGENYLRATDWIYLRIFWNSLKLASLTSISCLLIGYPMAYVMATARQSSLRASDAGGDSVLDELRRPCVRDQDSFQ